MSTAVRIHKSARNAISLPPRKRQAPDVPTLRISNTSDTNERNEIEPLQPANSNEQFADTLIVEERRKSTPPPPLPSSPPPIGHEESVLLSLEASYPYSESETIKIKEVHNATILPSPPPYQESDPLAQIHFKKFTKKKTSSTPLPSPTQNIEATNLFTDPPKLRKTSFDSASSPKEQKLNKRHSFLNQVPTPTEVPKLAFDFPSASTSNLNDIRPESVIKPSKSEQTLVNDQSKSNEKKSLLEFFGLKMGGKTENDVSKAKIEKKDSPTAAKEKVEKPKVKKIRVLKTDKKENIQKVKVNQNERVIPAGTQVIVSSSDNTRQSDKISILAPQNMANIPNDVTDNRMEIDYFQKVKKAKSNRVPVIVKSPKPETKFEQKPQKNEVFRHEETFSAANGPLKVKKKKTKSVPEDSGVTQTVKPIEITSKEPNATTSIQFNDEVPIPKPRVFLKLNGFDDNNRDTEIDKESKQKIVVSNLSSPSSPSDTEDAWNLVAKHRLNTRAITATAISVRQKSESDEITSSSLLQTKQLEMLNKPKTMREMKREQEQRNEKVFNLKAKEDKESDTEA
ncbi:hypothetical protein Bhyg_01681 [Pseudolycoriella hygida]|uniref:Uncharacterized protein n=1 Tax=Pseudolycoriella hygida TaxID=35572 RepID=A0A9Q0N9Z8_9DIPT|nr:hypothetical protein Bhyg_01681 [Pseudolycoriella hygida]